MALFIVLEGLDHSGKTTFAQKLLKILEKENLKVFITFEPGATELGKKIRPILLKSQFPIHPVSELLLFLSDRYQHLHYQILPALKKYDIVFCDRFLYSTFVYQGFIKGVDPKLILNLHQNLKLFQILPDLVLFFHSSLEMKNKNFAKEKPNSDRFHELFKSVNKKNQNFHLFYNYYLKTFKILEKQTPHWLQIDNFENNLTTNLKKISQLILKKWEIQKVKK